VKGGWSRLPAGNGRYQRAKRAVKRIAGLLLPANQPNPAAGERSLVRSSPACHRRPKELPLAERDPNYDPETDVYRQIYRGHDNASAVTNSEGVTVFFDPDTHEVLGFSIARFSAYYQAHATPEGDFQVDLPTRVPANLEEEMDFDVEALRSGVRIAEFY
jgi:hypothetical protein